MRLILPLLNWLLPVLFLLVGIGQLLLAILLKIGGPINELEVFPIHNINAFSAGYEIRGIVVGSLLTLVGLAWMLKWRFMAMLWKSAADGVLLWRAAMQSAISRFLTDENTWHRLVVFTLVIYGVIMRVINMNVPITYDEAFSFVHFANEPFEVVLNDYSFPNNHIFHTILMKLSMSVFGHGYWGIRLPAFLAGIALLPLAYGWVRASFNKHIAVVVLALLACSNVLIEYGVEARGYSIWMCCFVVSSWAVVEWLKRGNKFMLLLFAGASVLAVYTTTAAIYSQALVALALIVGTWKANNNNLKLAFSRIALLFIGMAAMTVLLYSSILMFKGPAGISYHPHMGMNNWETFSNYLGPNLQYIWHYWHVNVFIPGAYLFMPVLFLFGMIKFARLRRWVLLGLLVALLLVLTQRLLAPARVWTYLYMLYVVGVVCGGYFLWDWIILKAKLKNVQQHVVVWMSGIAMLSCFVHYTTLNNEIPFQHAAYFNFEKTSLFLKENLETNDRIASAYPIDIPLEYYLIKDEIPYANFRERLVAGAYLYIVLNPEGVQTIQSACEERRIDPKRLGDPMAVYSENDIKIYKCEVY